MKELPVLFRPDMVKAILEGRKTMTRRVMKQQPVEKPPIQSVGNCLLLRGVHYASEAHFRHGVVIDFAPYQVGDHLWVKETYAIPAGDEKLIIYKATDEDVFGVKWKSGRFMFKKYARLWLEVTAVRAERLQEISEGDAIAEGWPKQSGDFDAPAPGNGGPFDWYRALWDSINGKTHPWASNPRVRAYSFRLLKGEYDGQG